MSIQIEPEYVKPLPLVEPEAKPFWDSLKAHDMKLQRCQECSRWFFPPRTICPNCLSENVEWTAVSGRGRVYSAVTYHISAHPSFTPQDLPYNVSIIELDEGVHVMGNVIGLPTEQVRIGVPVSVSYDDVTDEFTLARFRPA